ncbi:glycosyltransferase [Micromonospora sp. NPDC050200]|uniref:glycosyltransferase family 4 protein n=1 Tax=Micromonospora sp. NPDC050200 TaxID=3155664 RepID=UPI0033C354D2
MTEMKQQVPAPARSPAAIAHPKFNSHLRVALVTHNFDGSGGVATVARWFRDTLTRAGYEVDVHNLATTSVDPASRRLAVPWTWSRSSIRMPLDTSVAWHWGANAVEVEWMRYRPRRELSRALRGYDCVQVVCGTSAWAGVVTGLGVPVVLQVATAAAWERATLFAQNLTLANRWRQLMTAGVSRLERTALREVDAVLVENAVMATFVRSVGQERVVFAPPGVDTSFFTPPTGGWRRDGYLLSLCRLADPRKGLDRLVDAYALLVQAEPGVPELVLAGSGRLPEGLVARIAALGVTDRVEVRPDVPPADLVGLYQGASVFLQTSYEEGLGLSAIEAMACGLPVVSTSSAGAIEVVVDGVTGCLVPLEPADAVPATVAARTRELLRGAGDEAGRRGRERVVERFSTEVAVRAVLETYDELLAARPPRGPVPPQARPRAARLVPGWGVGVSRQRTGR